MASSNVNFRENSINKFLVPGSGYTEMTRVRKMNCSYREGWGNFNGMTVRGIIELIIRGCVN